jgi:hypothetical protein
MVVLSSAAALLPRLYYNHAPTVKHPFTPFTIRCAYLIGMSIGPGLDKVSLAPDFKHDAQMDPSDAGDDAEIYLQKYLTDAAQLVINPGECVGITIPDGAADYDIELTLLERA